jgi:hypothetical protein
MLPLDPTIYEDNVASQENASLGVQPVEAVLELFPLLALRQLLNSLPQLASFRVEHDVISFPVWPGSVDGDIHDPTEDGEILLYLLVDRDLVSITDFGILLFSPGCLFGVLTQTLVDSLLRNKRDGEGETGNVDELVFRANAVGEAQEPPLAIRHISIFHDHHGS